MVIKVGVWVVVVVVVLVMQVEQCQPLLFSIV